MPEQQTAEERAAEAYPDYWDEAVVPVSQRSEREAFVAGAAWQAEQGAEPSPYRHRNVGEMLHGRSVAQQQEEMREDIRQLIGEEGS